MPNDKHDEKTLIAQLENIKQMPDDWQQKRYIDVLIQKYGQIECASAAREHDIDLAKEIIRRNKEVCFRSGGHIVSNCKCSLCESEVHFWRLKSSYDREFVYVCMNCSRSITENPWNEGDLLELKFQ